MLRDLFDQQEAEIKRDRGMDRAEKHANKKIEYWTQTAMLCLDAFLKSHQDVFLVEDVRRYASSMGMPEPPSKRAWGPIIKKSCKRWDS